MVVIGAAADRDLRDDERRFVERAAAMLANDRRRLLPFAILAPVGPAVRGLARDRFNDAVEQLLHVLGDAGDLERAVDQFERRFDRDRLRRPALRIEAADQSQAVDLKGEIIVMAGDDKFVHRLARGVDPIAKRQSDLGIVHGPNRRDPAVMANRRQRTGLPDRSAHSFSAARYSFKSRSRLAFE